MTAEHDTETHSDMEGTFQLGARLGKAVVKGMLVALPIAYIGLVLALTTMTDRNFQQSLETSVLPGMLIGVFFGGFFGMAVTLLAVEKLEKAERKSRQRNR